METMSPNIAAIIVMAVVYMGIGWLWYSPMLFGNMICCASKTKEEDKCCCWKSYGGEFLLACIIGYVLSSFALAMNANTIMSGMKLGFWAWLGFVATTMFSKVLWTHKPLVNFYVSSGFYLVIMTLMGAVLAVWH